MVKRESGSGRTQAERSDATRAALVAAARELFASKGYSRAGREEIVARAHLTRGALQHHFRDKPSLFLAVYEEVESEVVDSVALSAMDAGPDPVEQLRAGCHAYLDAVLDPAVQQICAVDGPAVLGERVRQEITDRYALGMVREVLQVAVDNDRIEATPVDPLARMLLAGIIAAAQFVALSREPLAARREAGRTVDLLLDAVSR